jgi:electron transfer flavoprotein alpha subunit
MTMPELREGAQGVIVRETCPVSEDELLVKVLEVLSDKKGKGQVDIAGADFIV